MNRSVIPWDRGCGAFPDSICSYSFVFLTLTAQTMPQVLCLTSKPLCWDIPAEIPLPVPSVGTSTVGHWDSQGTNLPLAVLAWASGCATGAEAAGGRSWLCNKPAAGVESPSCPDRAVQELQELLGASPPGSPMLPSPPALQETGAGTEHWAGAGRGAQPGQLRGWRGHGKDTPCWMERAAGRVLG